jgi:hypothetical protein
LNIEGFLIVFGHHVHEGSLVFLPRSSQVTYPTAASEAWTCQLSRGN